MGYWMDWKAPKTYNEKLQLLKLHDRKSIYTSMVDKIAVKEYVKEKIGEEYIIPTIGVWNHFDEIDFNKLPNRFVLKCSHDSGGVIVCKDKNLLDKNLAKQKIEKSLSKNFFYHSREWPYKRITPRILAETYMEDSETSELRDYKFFCFNGVVKALFIASGRQKKKSEVRFDFFDRDFNHLPITKGHPYSEIPPQKPVTFDKMLHLAEQLSKDIPHVRVDLYAINGKIYFGELTFFSGGGFIPFEPFEWDYTFGSWITNV